MNEVREHAHPEPPEYVRVAVALAIITLIEVSVYYIGALQKVLVPILIVLSAAKFSLVALWFMHLKFDSRLFAAFFAAGIAIAITVFTVVRVFFV